MAHAIAPCGTRGVGHVVAALKELLRERLRYREALKLIGQQLEHLAGNPAPHIHLEPLEPYRELVRSRLFPLPPRNDLQPPALR